MLSNDQLIKHAYAKLNYSEAQIEHLVKCMDPDTGPLYFMEEFLYVQHPIQGRIKFHAYEFQKGLIDTYHKNKNAIAMVSRQMGKTTCAAAYLLWYAIFNPDATILIASNKHDNAMEIMQRVRYGYEELPDYIRAGVTSYNKKSIEFDNGSRIISQATTANTGRTLSITLLYLDEFAYVEPRMAAEFWTSISPTLSTGGKCIITSTPNTDEDQFAQLWFGANKCVDEYGNPTDLGINGFKGFKADWREHPDRDQKWADTEEAKIGSDRFRREHLVEFIIFDETLIRATHLIQMKGKEPIRMSGAVRWYEPIDPTKSYTVGLDPAMGSGGNFAALEVFEMPSLKQVAEWQSNTTLVEDQMKVLKSVSEELRDAGVPDTDVYWSVENNSLGEACLVVIRDIGEESFYGTMVHDPNRSTGIKSRKGFNTSRVVKKQTCSRLKGWIEQDKMKINSKNLISELKTFVAKGTGYQAKVGCSDDLVMSSILSIRMIEVVANWDDDIHESIATVSDDKDEDDAYDLEPMPIGFL